MDGYECQGVEAINKQPKLIIDFNLDNNLEICNGDAARRQGNRISKQGQ
jgi:hypothetical protein